MAFSLGEYQEIFLEEADEQLQEMNQNLLELEKNPEDIEIINNIFRAAHSLKSSAGFVGLNDLGSLAHKMENLLQGIRDRTLGITDEVVEIIFKCFDEIRAVIDDVAAGEKPERDLAWLIEDIQRVSENARVQDNKATGHEKTVGHSDTVPKTVLDNEARKKIREGLDDGLKCCEITVFVDDKAQMKWVKAQLVVNNLAKIGDIVTTIPSVHDFTEDDTMSVIKVILLSEASTDEIRRAANVDLIQRVDMKSISLSRREDKLYLKFGDNTTFTGDVIAPPVAADAAGRPASEAEQDTAGAASAQADADDVDEDEEEFSADSHDESAPAGKKGADRGDPERKKVALLRTVKVSIDKLDLLLNNVGELVIANSGFYKLYEEMRKINVEKSIVNEFKSRMEQMSRIAKDLQSGIMKTRMVPIGQVFTRFNRLVRDLARDFNKQVELIIKGEDTELDKKVIDSIGEPLLHLIRNAIDHGIETSDERLRIGKPELARVTLNAYQGGNQIFVEVSDDGRGLNIDSIKRKALERGLTTPEMLSVMDNLDIYNFIFTPGFSTKDKVTDISGRGVGMNVVKEIVSELNGSVSIETEAGMGTRFVLAFPITLAIIPAIMTRVRKEMYAIPLTDVIETIKISQSEITTIEGHEVINLRGEILSLLRLNRFISLKSALREDQKIPVVVVGFGNRKIGLIVDYLEGKQEIVIKSLEQNYATVEGLAGASILGDGSICLILDIASMINRVIAEQDRLSSFDRDRIMSEGESEIEEVEVEPTPQQAVKTSAIDLLPSTRGSVGFVLSPQETAPQEPRQTQEERGVKKPVETPPPVVPVPEKKPVVEKLWEADSQSMTDKTPGTGERMPAGESVTDRDGGDDGIKDKVHQALDEFREELRENIKTTVMAGEPSDHMEHQIDVTSKDLSEFQVVANIGAANAAESLSKILNKRIDLSIPEIAVRPTEHIPKYIGDMDSIYMGIMMPVQGDIKGTVLFIFKEQTGFELVDLLYGTTSRETRVLSEDGQSALQELTNIVGSAVINVFAEKTSLVIKPGLPTIVHDYLESVIDSILVLHNMVDEYAVVMDTSFYFEDDQIIGNLMILPEAQSLKIIVERMRANVG